MTFIEQLQAFSFWNNTGYDYALALVILIASVIVLKIFQVVILSRLRKLAKKTKTDLDDVLIDVFTSLKPPFYFVIAVYIGIKVLTLPDLLTKIVDIVFLIVIVYEIVHGIQKIIDYSIRKLLEKNDDKKAEKQYSEAMLKALSMIIKISLWVIAIVLILSNLGINVTSLIASLGIGGIAIALALQGILSDTFSSFSIYVDKPFQMGDYITVGADSGTVEKIGLKSTRLRTLQGEELVISNTELTAARISNFKKMQKRRVVVTLGVVYETSAEKLKKIPVMLQSIVEKTEKTKFSRCHFKEYADSSLNFELVYEVTSKEYDVYMDINQKINFSIFEQFGKEKIDFAYPTQTVFVQK